MDTQAQITTQEQNIPYKRPSPPDEWNVPNKLGGRPVELTKEHVQIAEEYIKQCMDENKIPYKEQLQLKLDCDNETMRDWTKRSYRFSAAIKRIETLQRMLLQHGGLASKVSVPMAIFLLKANHGMIETDRHEHGGLNGEQLQFNIITGEGFIPRSQQIITASDADIVEDTKQIQSSSVASESKENNDSDNGVGETSTP